MRCQTSSGKLGDASTRRGHQQHPGITEETARTGQQTKNGYSLTTGRQTARDKVAQSQTHKPSHACRRASRAKEFEEIESRKQTHDW
jgi:hypothetical protein